MRILSIFGTRPEAIKMAPIIKEFEKHDGSVESIICVTGQHREMLDQVLSLFDIIPQFDLNIMEPNQSLPSLMAKLITSLSDVFNKVKPDVVLVQGDTTTAMVGSLVSFYHKVPIGHIEAGLRTYDKYNPFPEEVNRKLITALATYNFAPTQNAVNALMAEGIAKESIFLTGNTVIDALLMTINKKNNLDLGFEFTKRKIILVTAHRRENFGASLTNICKALSEIARRNSEIDIVYPVHLNPNVRNIVFNMLSNESRIHLIEPLEYDDFCHLMKISHIVLTDSGGIQEEAPALGKPVLVLRNETERSDAIEAGCAKIVGSNKDLIVSETEKLLNDEFEYNKMSKAINPYGDGHAAERIVAILLIALANL